LDWDHLTGLKKALTISQSANFTINPLKCEWVVSRNGLVRMLACSDRSKTMAQKNDAVLSMGCKHHKPSNSCNHLSVRSRFIVTCFQDDRII
jgi:hypothetical protein